jgi:translation initiation factor eIF-2B subunit delta
VPEILPELHHRIALIASDRESGASEILDDVLSILADALAMGAPIRMVGRALCRAQPTMASVWNAVLEAVAATEEPERFERFRQRVARAPKLMARVASDLFAQDGQTPLRVVTLSFSRSVTVALEAVAATRPVRVSCSESRPALEGRRLASRLAAAGLPVVCFSDAAVGHALAQADAVVVGADAVAPASFLNKSGTWMLAAAAAQRGVPVYVLATRDKFVSHAVNARLAVPEGAPEEIWPSPPPGVEVRNPYFESTPLDLVTGVVSDIGLLGAGMVPQVCEAVHDPRLLRALDEL